MKPLTVQDVFDVILPPDTFKQMPNNERKRRHLPMYRKVIKNRGAYRKWKAKCTNEFLHSWEILFSSIIVSKRKYTGVIHSILKEDKQCRGMTRV